VAPCLKALAGIDRRHAVDSLPAGIVAPDFVPYPVPCGQSPEPAIAVSAEGHVHGQASARIARVEYGH
jgi:hypothetical protein